MANPVRELFDPKPAAARVVLVDTNGDIYNATGGSGGGDVNITEIGGNPVTTTIPVSGTVSISGTVPVSAVNLDIRDLVFATDKVDVSGSSVAITGTVTVSATDLDIRNLVFATDKVDASGTVLGAGTNNIGDVDVASIAAGDNTIGRVKITDGTDVALVTAAGEQNVLATAQPGVDIGDVTINNGSGAGAVNIQDGGNIITVDGTVTSNQGTPAATANRWPVQITDGTDLALVTAAGEVNVLATAQPGVDIGDVTINNASGASAVNIQDGGNSLTVDQATAANLNAEVQGDAAHDAPASGNPVLCGASAETMADSAPANRVSTDGDAMRFSATDGAAFVIPTGPQTWTFHENSSSQLTDTVVHASPGGGLSLYVTDIAFSTGAATAFNIFFEEGTTTTVLGPWYLEAINGRGAAIHFGTPKKITAATSLTVTTSAAIAHSIDVQGFIAPG